MSFIHVKLKQHTPIVHYQYNQKDATLRASDVKPRLDDYLKNNCSYKRNEPIRYELRILIDRNIANQQTIFYKKSNDAQNESSGLYFGNQGKAKTKQCVSDSSIKLVFNTYFNEKLKQDLKEQIPIMFALENFGSRNNKGLGCFFPEEIDGKKYGINDFESILKRQIKPKLYYWDVKNFSDVKEILFEINQFYSLVKSNINLDSKYIPNGKSDSYATYYKSRLLLHFLSQNISWEKRKIKYEYHFIRTNEQDENNIVEHKYLRAVLGVARNQNWAFYHKEIKVEESLKEYDRVPSSLMLKVFNSEVNSQNNARIYYWFNNNFEKIIGKEFSFHVSEEPVPLKLNVPSEFDCKKFLEFVYTSIKSLTILNNNGTVADKVIKEINSLISLERNEQAKYELKKKIGIIKRIQLIDHALLNIKNNLNEYDT
ncbi:MAG: hypothetical protein ACYDA4_13835 [Ignavibacteriaceae bacterium]